MKSLKIFSVLVASIMLLVLTLVIANTFTPVTPPSNSTQIENYTNIEYNFSSDNLTALKWIWDGTNTTILDSSILVYLNLDNRASIGENATHAVDLTYYGNNGTMESAVSTVSGKFDGAMDLESNNSHITVANNNRIESMETAGASVSMWVNPNHDIRDTEWDGFFSSHGAGSSLQILKTGSDDIRVGLGGQGGATWGIDSDWTGEWHHIVASWSGVNPDLNLWVDGVLVAQDNATGSGTPTISFLEFGRYNADTIRAIDVIMDEVYVMRGVIGQAEVLRLYNESRVTKYSPNLFTFNADENLTVPLNDSFPTHIYPFQLSSSNATDEVISTPLKITHTRTIASDINNVTIVLPVNGTHYNSINSLNYSVNFETGSCWFSNSSTYAHNSSPVNGGVNWSISAANYTEGWNNYTVFCNSTENSTVGQDSVLFFIDTTGPVITITEPANASDSPAITFDLKYVYTEPNKDRCWYSKDAGVTNSTSVSTGTNWSSISASAGLNSWIVWCNDTFNNIGSTSTNFTSTPPGNLTLDWNFPTTNHSVAQYGNINISMAVTCIDSNCGNVTVYMDPEEEKDKEKDKKYKIGKNYKEICDNGVCKLEIYGEEKYSNYLEIDDMYPIRLVSYNPETKNITLELAIEDSMNDKSWLRVWEPKDKKDKDKKDKDIDKDNYKQKYKLVSEEEVTIPYGEILIKSFNVSQDEIIEFGPNSTVLLINYQNTTDTYCEEFSPTTNYNSYSTINIRDGTSYNATGIIVFDLTSLPTINKSLIINSTLRVYMTHTMSSAESFRIGVHHLYDGYNINATTTWNTRPTSSYYNTTKEESNILYQLSTTKNVFNSFNVTNALRKSNDSRAAFYFIATNRIGNIQVGEFVSYASSEDTNSTRRPTLIINYNHTQEKGLISTVVGTQPFYTYNDNPQTINLSLGETKILNWTVNASSDLYGVWKFFAYANITESMGVNNVSPNIYIDNTVHLTAPTLNITAPLNKTYASTQSGITFTYVEPFPDVCWWSNNSGTTNTTVPFSSPVTGPVSKNGTNVWFLWCNDTTGLVGQANVTFKVSTSTFNAHTFNSTTYSTKKEKYIGNASYDSSLYYIGANITWNGTTYNATATDTGGDAILSWDKIMPVVTTPTNISFYWSLLLVNKTNTTHTVSQNVSTTQSFNITNISFYECKDISTHKLFAKFDFKDSVTSAVINASISEMTWDYYLGNGSINQTLSFTNTTKNLNYSFCFSENLTLHNNLNMRYENSPNYPTQIHIYSTDLTNATTNTTLTLADTTSGSYSSFQVQTNNGNGLGGVTVNYEKKIAGVFVFQGSDSTDGSGTVTFFLDFNSDYRFSFSKAGYVSESFTVRPTQSLYTITLQLTGGGSRSAASYFSPVANLSWSVGPVTGEPLDPNETHTFTFNTYSSTASLTYYLINLTNSTGGQVAALNGTNSVGANISIVGLNISNLSRVKGYYWANSGNGTKLLTQRTWYIGDIIPGNGSIKTVFDNFDNYDYDDEEKYTMFFFIFFGAFLLLALISRIIPGFMEITNPAVALILIGFGVLILSIGGILTIDFSPYDFVDKYGIFLTFFMMAAGVIMGVLNRN